jgi:hypothetical protein
MAFNNSGFKTITYWANDTLGAFTSQSVMFSISAINATGPFFETDAVNFSIDYIFDNGTYPGITGALVYNGVSYPATQIPSSVNNFTTFIRQIDLPSVTGASQNFSYFWNFTLFNSTATLFANTSSFNNTVNNITWTLCKPGYNVAYLNLTFIDEMTGLSLNGSIDSSSWLYYLGSGTQNQSYTFSNSSLNPNYAFCFNPVYRAVTQDAFIQFSSTGYPIRTYDPQSTIFTNTTTNQPLYLLSSANGIYTSIQTAESSNAVISGVYLLVERQINGVYVTIASGTTDSGGLSTFWLNPSFTYRVTASKVGYSTAQVMIQPSQSVYTIVMSQAGAQAAAYNGSTVGMLWTITPQSGYRALGTTTFGFNLTANYGNLESCKFELYNTLTNTTVTSTIGGTAYGCNLSLVYAVSAESRLVARIYIDTTSTDGFMLLDGDQSWIYFESGDSAWTTFDNFMSSLRDIPEFGEGYRGAYSRIIFFFFFLTVLLGLFTYTTGYDLANPGIVLLLLFIIIVPFSMNGWFYVQFPNAAVPTPEFIDWLQQYWLALWLGMITAGYWLNQWSKY